MPFDSPLSAHVDPARLRDLPLDLDALDFALTNNAPDVHSYLHKTTGVVMRLVDGVADPTRRARMDASVDYERVPTVGAKEQYGWLEHFIETVPDDDLACDLEDAIEGKGAFRAFKDVLSSRSPAEWERWQTFRRERARPRAEAWLALLGLRAAPPAKLAPLVARAREMAPIIRETPLASGLRLPLRDELVSRIADVAGTLGAQDLEKVVAFAAFVRVAG